LSHRIELKPSAKYLQSPKDFVKEKFEKFIEAQGEELEAESRDSL